MTSEARASIHITGINVQSPSPRPLTIFNIRLKAVAPNYKIVATMENSEVVSDGPPLLVRVDPSNLHLCSPNLIPGVKTKKIHIQCQDKDGTWIDGCSFRIVGEFPDDADDGGHERSKHPPRPTQLFSEPFPVDFTQFTRDGTDFSYKVPDASGEIDLKILGKGPSGEEASPFVIRVRVQTKGLVPINVPGLQFDNLITHVAGVYGTVALNAAVADMTTNFKATLESAGVAPQNIPNLKSQGANLPWGGLFDIGEDHRTPGWSEPHCGHRGNNIDITVSDLSQAEKTFLRKAIIDAGMRTPYHDESPDKPGVIHWHLQK